jgi:hypothetical protein
MLGLFGSDSDESHEEIVSRVANRILAAIWPQLNDAIERMDAAELRGYMRAHTQASICAELLKLVDRGQIRQSEVANSTKKIEASIIHEILAAAKVSPTVSIPVPHTTNRKAA